MALQTSGSMSLYDISNEFGGYAYPPVEIDDYMTADPVNQSSYGNSVGSQVDFADFYGCSIRTVRITSRPNADTYARYGYSRSNGYFFYLSESGQSGTAFGQATRTSSLATGSRTLACVVMTDDTFYDEVTVGFSGGSSSTNGGFTRIDFHPVAPFGAGSGPYYPNTSTTYTLYRTDASFSALPGTSPTVYGYRWGVGHSNSAGSAVQSVASLIKDTAGATPYWLYMEFF